MSRVATSERPAGTPSTITVSCGPCDSPAVRNRSICNGLYWRGGVVPHLRDRAPGRLSASGPDWKPRLSAMRDVRRTRESPPDHLRIARLLEAHGDVVGAICAYREAMREGPETAANEALLRIAALARRV